MRIGSKINSSRPAYSQMPDRQIHDNYRCCKRTEYFVHYSSSRLSAHVMNVISCDIALRTSEHPYYSPSWLRLTTTLTYGSDNPSVDRVEDLFRLLGHVDTHCSRCLPVQFQHHSCSVETLHPNETKDIFRSGWKPHRGAATLATMGGISPFGLNPLLTATTARSA